MGVKHLAMGVKYHHTKCEQETQQWPPRTTVASGRPTFQHLSKIVKKCTFWGSLEGAICIETNLDDEQTPVITIQWVLHPISGLNDLFDTAKSALKSRRCGGRKHVNKALYTCTSWYAYAVMFDSSIILHSRE